MTYFDEYLDFGQVNFASTNLAPGGFAECPDVIDTDALRDIGKGYPLLVSLRIDTAINVTLTGAEDYAVFSPAICLSPASTSIVTQIAAGTVDVIARGGDYAAANSEAGAFNVGGGNFNSALCTAGSEFFFYLPPLQRSWEGKRYLGIAFIAGLASATITSGTATARLCLNGQTDMFYGSGFSVGV